MKKPRVKIPLTRSLDYFEFNERSQMPHVTRLDTIEWDEPPPSPSITVKESRDKRLIARAKRKWERHLKDYNK